MDQGRWYSISPNQLNQTKQNECNLDTQFNLNERN